MYVSIIKMNQAVFDTLKSPSGGSLPVYSGSRRFMTGTGFFSTLSRFIVPILKNIGRRLVKTGVRAGAKILSGENVGQSITSELLDEGVDLAKDAIDHVKTRINKSRSGRGVKRLSINKKPNILKKVKFLR